MSRSPATRVQAGDAPDAVLASVAAVIREVGAGATVLRVGEDALRAQLAAALSGFAREEGDLWISSNTAVDVPTGRLRAVGPIARRALAGATRDVVTCDRPGTYGGDIVVADTTPLTDWVAEVHPDLERASAVRVVLDPFQSYLSPIGGPVEPLVVATRPGPPERGHQSLHLGHGFTVPEVRQIVAEEVDPSHRPVLVLDPQRLDNALDIAVGVVAAASLCIPATSRGPLADHGYLGPRTSRAVARWPADGARRWSPSTWHQAGAALRTAAVGEHVLGAVLEAVMASPGAPTVSVFVPPGAQSAAEQVLDSVCLAEVLVDGPVREELQRAARGRGIDVIEVGASDAGHIATVASGHLVTAVVPDGRYAPGHLDALVGLARHTGSARVRGGVASVEVAGLDVELGGPFDAFPAASTLVPRAELALSGPITPGSVDATLVYLAAGASYAPTMSVSLRTSIAEILDQVGSSAFEVFGQWPPIETEVRT